MRIKHHAGAVSLVHEGETYLADADGYIDAPFELAQTLLLQHVWDTEEPQIYIAPEPEIVVPEPPAPPVNPLAASIAEAEATPAEERTPYQKGLLTRAANEAAKAAAEAK